MPVITPSVVRYLLTSCLSALFALTATLVLAAPDIDSASIPDTLVQRMKACAICHGPDGRASSDGFYPRIAGKPDQYLLNQLRNFQQERRQYPAMTFLLGNLSDDYLQEIAHYYAQQNPPYAPPQPATVAAPVLARGKELALSGDKSKKIPACIACHGNRLTGIAPSIPGLLGLPKDYLNAQFGSWRNKSRQANAPDCMAQITANMSLDDIHAVSSWLAVQPVPASSTPEPRLTTQLPMPCGGIE